MKAGYKVLIGLAVVLGLAFFFFKKPAEAEDAVPVSTGAGGGVVGTIIGGVKKIFGKVFAPVAAASIVPTSAIEMAGAGGVLPIGGAPAVTSTLGSPIAAGEVVPGSAVNSGAAVLGESIATAGFFAGFVLALLDLGKDYDWTTEQERYAAWQKYREKQIELGYVVEEYVPKGLESVREW